MRPVPQGAAPGAVRLGVEPRNPRYRPAAAGRRPLAGNRARQITCGFNAARRPGDRSLPAPDANAPPGTPGRPGGSGGGGGGGRYLDQADSRSPDRARAGSGALGPDRDADRGPRRHPGRPRRGSRRSPAPPRPSIGVTARTINHAPYNSALRAKQQPVPPGMRHDRMFGADLRRAHASATSPAWSWLHGVIGSRAEVTG
jgi:hypothetical protein